MRVVARTTVDATVLFLHRPNANPALRMDTPPSLNWQALGTARAILRRTRTLTRTCLNRKIPKNCGFSGTWPGVSPWPRDRSTRRRGCAGCFLFKEKRVSSCFEDCSDRGQRRLQEKTQMLNACKANNTSSGNEAGEFSRLTMRASGAHIAVWTKFYSRAAKDFRVKSSCRSYNNTISSDTHTRGRNDSWIRNPVKI